MPLIKVIEKEEATGKVSAIYEGMIKSMGMVPNAFKLFSTSEYLLEQQTRNLTFFMQHDKLSGKLLAFIRLLVSEMEQCKYCVGMNTGILWHYGVLPEAIEEIKKDPAKAPLEEKEIQLLLFVLKVIKNSNQVDQSDMEQLRNLGWSDSEILEATYHGTSQVGTDMLFNAFKLENDR